MYRTCIFCTGPLGRNEAVEQFTVGSTLAFDPWKGRLWAVCPRCARWNLAPLEERWEAVEGAERQFADTRLRVHSENVGLAQLADGTRLIRVGRALPGEVAAWRYGRELHLRRWRHAPVAVGGFLLRVAVDLCAWPLSHAAVGLARVAHGRSVLHRIPAESSPAGREILVRRGHVSRAWLQLDEEGDLGLHVPEVLPAERDGNRWRAPSLLLRGGSARRVLARALVDVNAAGASGRNMKDALAALGRSPLAEDYLRETARQVVGLGMPDLGLASWSWGEVLGRAKGQRREARFEPPKLSAAHALALEMALHEESERKAFEGELSALEAAWREAEEIAAIADGLPDAPAG